jgi:phospholipid/cholesterol/gamma-HCH transport system substrate-binding protein
MDKTPLQDSEPAAAPAVPHLAAKARLLLLFTVLLIGSAGMYLLYARGVFEPTQRLVLTTDDSEGVSVGMDMTFSGFPIGRVREVELGPNAEVRILIDVARKDAHWLRTGSVFTLVRGLVGGTTIRAFTGVLTDPPLSPGAERPVLRGDATAELPRVIAAAREVLENLTAMTATDAALRNSIANVQAVTDKLKGPQGALGVLFGNEADARKLLATLERTNALLARFDALAVKADSQVFGPEGVMREARATVVQLNGLLADTRVSITKLDAVLVEAQGVGANVRGATQDLGQLRGEVEANLRKVESLINEINRKWPFSRETEIKLP